MNNPTMNVPITLQEVAALFEIASRAPKTGAEAIWFQNLVTRWNQSQAAAQAAAESARVDVAEPSDNGRDDPESERLPQARGEPEA